MWISQSEGTDTKAGVALQGLSCALEGKREGYGQVGAHPAQEPKAKYKGQEPRECRSNWHQVPGTWTTPGVACPILGPVL